MIYSNSKRNYCSTTKRDYLRHIKALHRSNGDYAPPAGALFGDHSKELRASPEDVEEDPDYPYNEDNSRPLLQYSLGKAYLRTWVMLKHSVGDLSDEELSELRAALKYEAKLESYESDSFLGSVEYVVDTEFARRESCGHTIREAEPWPMTKSSATVVCKLSEISANAPSYARLMHILYSQKARDPFTPLNPRKAWLLHPTHSKEDVVALSLQHNSRRLEELPQEDFEQFRTAMETLDALNRSGPIHNRPDSFAAHISAAIEKELFRRKMVA
jgi:hypothetical protein